MAAPVVTGIVGLLVEEFRLRGYGPAGYTPPASLVKAILIHTAQDLGRSGPDYMYGWGLVDARAAVELIEKDYAGGRWVRFGYETLAPGQSLTWPVSLNAPQNLRVTIAWADPAGAPNTGGEDNPTPALVHDLELRIIGPDGTVYEPYRLDPTYPDATAARGPNHVDNVEMVEIAGAAAGTYIVKVSHSGALSAPQPFAIVFGIPKGSSSGGGGRGRRGGWPRWRRWR
jgi:hypothetical protein